MFWRDAQRPDPLGQPPRGGRVKGLSEAASAEATEHGGTHQRRSG